MASYFVSRHKGAVDWVSRQNIDAKLVTHLDTRTIRPGDIVYGTLPVSEAARVCAQGGRYFHLHLPLPPHARGKELTARDMEEFGAELKEYQIKEL